MYIRRHLILKGMSPSPNKTPTKRRPKYVSAKAQARLISLMLEEQVLTEKEEEIYNVVAIPIATPRPKMLMW